VLLGINRERKGAQNRRPPHKSERKFLQSKQATSSNIEGKDTQNHRGRYQKVRGGSEKEKDGKEKTLDRASDIGQSVPPR